MADDLKLCILQEAATDGLYPIKLRLIRPGKADIEGKTRIEFSLTKQQRLEIQWYLEEYLQIAGSIETLQVQQIEEMMKRKGEELYQKVLAADSNTQTIWYAVREQLADLRIEITTGIVEAASIPWELMRDPNLDSPIAERVKSFVRVESDVNISFVDAPTIEDGQIRLLYVACRPGGREDVPLRAVANRLLQGLGANRKRFEITALRPPSYPQLQKVLQDAKQKGRPYHIVHFDGHGIYIDVDDLKKKQSTRLSCIMFNGDISGKHGVLLFENPDSKDQDKIRYVLGEEIGKLLHDNDVPVLVLNACQSAMHEAVARPHDVQTTREEVRAIGSLTQSVIEQGVPVILAMRYSVYVVTAAQYIGELYASLAKGRGFGQAATEGRKDLYRNPERWLGLTPRSLQDWMVPVVYEATPITLVQEKTSVEAKDQIEMDPLQLNRDLLRYAPDYGFVGRDETILMLDRAFDEHRIVLLHAYAGQGKTTTAVEFSRWYSLTGGLSRPPLVLLTSFEYYNNLTDVINQIGNTFKNLLLANGINWSAIGDLNKRRDLIIQLLRVIPVLWIWDNVEPVGGFPTGTESTWTKEEQKELADFLKQIKLDPTTQAKILLTSRRNEKAWLGEIPHRVSMPRMSLPDAASLAVELGRDKKVSRTTVAQWQALLDYCAGNPLTLAVMARQAIHKGLSTKEEIETFVQAVRDGEEQIEDVDETEGRDRSLGASLAYGFDNAFTKEELAIIALLHLFQGTVDIDVLQAMGEIGDYALAELKGKTNEELSKLLDRAVDIGLLKHLGSTWYIIHPALPWFLRQIFEEYYDSRDGRSNSDKALRAWVESIGALGNFYHQKFNEGTREVIDLLGLEEANLLHARRIARKREWWDRVTSAMQGLKMLYQYQGRRAEWSRLVEEIVPDYCTAEDEPVTGRENTYSLVMGYRVDLARIYDHDLPRAASLQEKRIAWNRKKAVEVLALPEDVVLDDIQRNRIRTLAVSLEYLGHILREQGQSECIEQYEQSIRYSRRIKDTAEESIAHFNLGHAYMQIADIRDLDAAESEYQQSLGLLDINDALGRSKCISQIGMVHHHRFMEARKRKESQETLLKHCMAAETYYLESLGLCPQNATSEFGSSHLQLGNLYDDVGKTELARQHFEKAVQYYEKIGDHYNAGKARSNIAASYTEDALREETAQRRNELLDRAMAYAQASLGNFKHYQGRATAEEERVQRLIDMIRKLQEQG